MNNPDLKKKDKFFSAGEHVGCDEAVCIHWQTECAPRDPENECHGNVRSA